MSKIFKRTYKFAAFTSLYITLSLTLINFLAFYFFIRTDYWIIPLFAVVIYLVCFFLIQYRVEKFIYNRIKKIYDDVSLLDTSNIGQQKITTNMETLTKEVERFAQHKKLEIEALKIRENYRKEFVGNVSHELKTPLFTVQGYILTLLDGALKDKKVRKKYLESASKDLDMISKLEAGDLNLNKENFNIVDLIRNVFDLLEIKASKKNIVLTLDDMLDSEILVFADRERIQQVLTNLIDNSIKYGKVGGTTEVSIEDLIKNKIIIRVTDNGEGIETRHLTRLFERFYRIDKSGSREVGGSGLGLSIVKHIIDAHNEKIYVESQFGVGSEFSFTIEKGK